jgi:DNA topoisomerase III
LASPELTGTWEARLSRVARGQETRAAFMADISRYVGDVVAAIRGGAGPVAGAGVSVPRPNSVPEPPARLERARKPARARSPAAVAPVAPAAPAARGAATVLTCPRCKKATLVAGHRGWGCARWREGCPFVIWFEVAGRRITEAELADLVTKGQTRKRKWRSSAGTEIGGRLVLDLAATREAGGARLDEGAAGTRRAPPSN